MGRRGGKKYAGRKKVKREQQISFHILCEGQNTEPIYFKSFPVSNVAHCKGYARSSLALVERAIRYKREQGITKKTKDEVWVVFDYDYNGELQPKQSQDFNNSIEKAISNNIKVAFSNDSFELWYLLHFESCNAQEGRDWYNQRLTEKFEFKYDKERAIAKRMYDLTIDNQSLAIQRAQALMEEYDVNDKTHAKTNPYTTVHLLVQELNKYIK